MSTAADFRNWLRTINRTHPAEAALLKDGPVYLGVSGGSDSLALAYSAVGLAKKREISGDLIAIVVDHQLQADSANVARRAAKQCEAMGLSATVVTVDVPGDDEAAARQARYLALGKQASGRPLLVGHTADDDAEGVLLGLARGSGTGAVAGPQSLVAGDTDHPAVLAGAAFVGRPLLASTRADTVATCRRGRLAFWTDPHNSDPRFLRSRVRTEVLPVLAGVLGEGVSAALARTARFAREDQDFLDATAADLVDQLVRTGQAGEGFISCVGLVPVAAPIRRRAIAHWLGPQTGPLTSDHLLRIDALVVDWAGQGGVSVPWPTINQCTASDRLVVERESGFLKLTVQQKSPPQGH